MQKDLEQRRCLGMRLCGSFCRDSILKQESVDYVMQSRLRRFLALSAIDGYSSSIADQHPNQQDGNEHHFVEGRVQDSKMYNLTSNPCNALNVFLHKRECPSVCWNQSSQHAHCEAAKNESKAAAGKGKPAAAHPAPGFDKSPTAVSTSTCTDLYTCPCISIHVYMYIQNNFQTFIPVDIDLLLTYLLPPYIYIYPYIILHHFFLQRLGLPMW